MGFVAIGGATVNASEHRYAAMTSGRRPARGAGEAVTVIAQIEKCGGRVSRWWQVPGRYYVPAAAPDDSAGGLSGDGGTLVLTGLMSDYPPRRTLFAVLDTDRHLHPPSGDEQRHAGRAIRRFALPGHFSFDAISPDGTKLYLVHHLQPRRPLRYEIRVLDLRSGRLLAEPLADPAHRGERMATTPHSRVSGRGGRWAYTLYAARSHDPVVHALDTVSGDAVRIGLPQLAGIHPRFFYLLHLEVDRRAQELTVMRHRLGPRAATPLLTIDIGGLELDDEAIDRDGSATRCEGHR